MTSHASITGATLAALLCSAAALAAPTTVFVELESPSTVQHVLASPAGAGADALDAPELTRAHAARLQREQDELLAAVRGARIEAVELFRASHLLNGVALEVNESDLNVLATLPGVASVRQLRSKTLATSSSVPFVGAPAVWNPQGLAALGTGVRVGIIDTGIDYIHKHFGGSGSYTGQRYDDDIVPWTVTVVGGYDFVGADYNGTNTPKPDPDPMDCQGHGSHVAGIVGGLGVDLDGNTYRGAYTPGMGFGGFRIGPGVAPGAKLYALRVFGCEGSTQMVIPALEWALDPNRDGDLSDRLDVVNLSLGVDYGDHLDPDAVAVERAVAAGVVVVAAGGNAGDGYFLASSPAVADGVIAVASVGDAGNVGYTLTVNQPPDIGTTTAYAASFGPPLAPATLTGDLVRANPPLACTPLVNAAQVAGKIVLVDRGDCTFVTKVRNAQLAGAAAVVVANNQTGVILMAGDDPTLTIPAVSITGEDGSVLRSKLPSPGVNVTLSKFAYADVISDFSSRGPRLGDLVLKPDLAAPGDWIASVDVGTGNGVVSLGGTSMAAPHVTGGVALVRQLHPDWPVHWLKAALINTSAAEVFTQPNLTPPLVGPGRAGSGRIDLARAASTSLLAFDDEHPGRVSVSFGRLEMLGNTAIERRIRLVNTGAETAQVDIDILPTIDMPGVELSPPDPSRVSVPAGGETVVTVRLSAWAATMRRAADPGIARVVGTQPRQWLAEAAGVIRFTPESGLPIILPYHAAPRPASAMTGEVQDVTEGGFAIALSGRGVQTGAGFPEDVVALVSGFELAAISPENTSLDAADRVGDLRYVGVATDFPAQKAQGKGLGDSRIYFGIATHRPWTTPGELRVDVLIDTNRDGKDDYQARTAGYGEGGDVHVVNVCTLVNPSCTLLHLNGLAPSVRDTALFATDVMLIPLPANLVGLSETSGRFNYKVRTFALASGKLVDETATLSFDLTRPGLSFGGTGVLGTTATIPMYEDLPGVTIPVQLDAAALAQNSSSGVLLLHHHNLPGQRAQVLGVGAGACDLSCTATVQAWSQPGTPATFEALATAGGCPETAFTWSFGDGSSGAGANTTHIFTAPGSYTWTLAATAGPFTCHRAGQILVSDTPPRIPRRRLSSR